MSFPNIPEFNPSRGISRNDALLRIIDAIALVEVSLSKLIDAKTEKINFIKACDCDALCIQDIMNINRRIERFIEIIRHLYLLLCSMLKDALGIVKPATI